MRPSISVVIPAWNEWELTRDCLESLRPTMGVRDEVIVVDNGSSDGTAQGLRRYPWAKVVSHPENLGFAGGCNSGAAVAKGDVVVFLNNDTLTPARWLDGLLAPFADPTVGATGPRSNFVSGPQLVESVDYDPDRMPEIHRFARAWRDNHRGQTTEVGRLVGFCLAVRRDLFDRLGGFDERFGLGGHEDDDLCVRIMGEGQRLLIAHESFVHHHGHRTFVANGVDWFALQQQNGQVLQAKYSGSAQPEVTSEVLLSACMIVRDEEDNLASCLTSLEGLVDEVVVYDTGSTDRTVEIARAAGATVLEGYWDDDFARARNVALEACRGRWILHVDADEVVEGDHAALRSELAASPAESLHVPIDNVDDNGRIDVTHKATRLFRRARAHWEGRLHEQVVTRSGGLLTAAHAANMRLRHFGYTSEMMERRQKTDRNLRVARHSAEGEGSSDALTLINLGRSLVAAGHNEESIVHFARARELTAESRLLRQALRFGAQALMACGRSAEALEWVQSMRSHSTSSSMPDFMEGMARLNLLDTAGALACFTRIDDVSDEDVAIDGNVVRLRRGLALAAAEQWGEAASELLEGVRDRRVTDPVWAPLAEAHWRAEHSLAAAAAAVDDSQLMTVLGQVLNASPLAADALAEPLWERFPHDPRLLAYAVRGARRLPLERALDWAARLRAAGLAAQCPVVALAEDATGVPLGRVQAAVVAAEAFSDERGEPALRAAAAALPQEEFRAALLFVDEMAPRLLPTLVMSVATTTSRCRGLAEVLRDLGAHEQADVLLAGANA